MNDLEKKTVAQCLDILNEINTTDIHKAINDKLELVGCTDSQRILVALTLSTQLHEMVTDKVYAATSLIYSLTQD